jgi:hypothetical protein
MNWRAATQRLQSVVAAASMHGDRQEPVIRQVTIALAQ